MAPSAPPPFLLALFPLLFVGLWCVVLLLLSRLGGWSRLAKRFPAQGRQPSGTCFSMQGGRVGMVNYNGCLTIHNSAEGLHLSVWRPFRLGHPPLFIPWDDVHNLTSKRFLWIRFVVFDVGSPSVAKLQLSEKIFEGHQVVAG